MYGWVFGVYSPACSSDRGLLKEGDESVGTWRKPVNDQPNEQVSHPEINTLARTENRTKTILTVVATNEFGTALLTPTPTLPTLIKSLLQGTSGCR